MAKGFAKNDFIFIYLSRVLIMQIKYKWLKVPAISETITGPFMIKVDTGNNYEPIIFRSNNYSYMLTLITVPLECISIISFIAFAAPGIINIPVMYDFFYFLCCYMPAAHTAPGMFCKNEMIRIPEYILIYRRFKKIILP